MINNNEIITNKTSSTKIDSKTVSEPSTNKDKPSLFDTLLGNNVVKAKKDETTSIIKNVQNKSSLIKDKTNESENISEEKTSSSKIFKNDEIAKNKNIDSSISKSKKLNDETNDKDEVKTPSNKSPLSLLDRLILESKQSMKNTDKNIEKKDNISSDINKNNIKSENTEINKNDSKINIDKNIKVEKNIIEKDSILDKKNTTDNDKNSKLINKNENISEKDNIKIESDKTISKESKNITNEKIISMPIVDKKDSLNTQEKDSIKKDTQVIKTLKIDNDLSNEKKSSVNVVDKKNDNTIIGEKIIKTDVVEKIKEDVSKTKSDNLTDLFKNIKKEVLSESSNIKDNTSLHNEKNTTNIVEVDTNTKNEKIDKNVKKENSSLFDNLKNSISLISENEVKKDDAKLTPNKENNKKEIKIEGKEETKSTLSNSIIDKEIKSNKNETIDLSEDKKIKKEILSNKIILNDENLTQTNNIKESNNTAEKNTKTSLIDNISNLDKKDVVLDKKTDVSKVEIKEEKESLMDKLLRENNATIKNKASEEEKTDPTKGNINLSSNKNSKEFLTNIYLNTQKNAMNNQSLANKSEALNTVKNAKSTKDIEKASEKLDLGLKEVKIEKEKTVVQDIVSKNATNDHFEHKNILNKIAFNRNIFDNTVKNMNNNMIENVNNIDKTLTTTQNEEAVINVPATLIQNMQLKIVAARQQMQSMMSDVAKKMYENYKPPVTAFRINLNPSNLGSISILMKNDKDTGISISMNISNSTTLDSFVENQNTLKSSLNKSFEEDTQFNLDFSSEDNNQSSNSNEDNNNKNKFNQKQVDTKAILESREDNLEKEDTDLDYM